VKSLATLLRRRARGGNLYQRYIGFVGRRILLPTFARISSTLSQCIVFPQDDIS
jgi:hypothetical protein